MSNRNKDNFTADEMPSGFSQLLTAKDADVVDTVLDRVSEEGFHGRSVEKKVLSAIGISAQTKTAPKRSTRSRFRVVMIAACIAVVSLVAFTAAKIIKDTRFLGLIGAEQAPEKMEDHYIPIGQTGKIGSLTVTAVDMIADADTMFIEVSTDCPIDHTDGWLIDDAVLEMPLGISCEVELPKNGLKGYSVTTAPFARDGKMWYMVQYINNEFDISRLPVTLTIEAYNPETKALENCKFNWTNDYEPKNKTVVVDREIGEYVIDSITLNVTEMKIQAFGKKDTCDWLTLDHITLTDGTELWYTVPKKKPLYTSISYRATKWRGKTVGEEAVKFFTLFDGFSKEKGGDPVFVSIEDIASVTINGVEIPVK